jgi:RNA polymerase sigma-70 factor, ECF subfamily
MEIQSGELVRAAALGDEAAFTELVARHHRDLLRVAYVICRDPALAEDSAQAAWTIAWRRIGDVEDPNLIRSWLVAVVANEARRVMRSRRRSVHEISVADIELEGVPDLRSDPLADRIAKADLRRVLASLDPTDRALIALRYIAELSSDEIGRALGMSSSGARGRLSRVLLRLRGDLRDD